jgi:hypothetical protein
VGEPTVGDGGGMWKRCNPRLSASPGNRTFRTRMAPLLFDPSPFFSSSSFTVSHAGHDRQIYQAHTQSHRSSWCHFELVVPRMHRMKSPSKRHASPGSHPSQTSSTQASSTMINFTSKGRHIFRPKLFPPVSDCAASPKAEELKAEVVLLLGLHVIKNISDDSMTVT